MACFVLDTNIILYFLAGRLAEPLPVGDYAISVISELELLAYPDLTAQEEQRVQSFLADIRPTELTPAIKTHAIDFRKRFGLKLPDAIVAATARSLEGTLITNDDRLLALPEIPTQRLPVLPHA